MMRTPVKAIVLCCREVTTLSYYSDWEDALSADARLAVTLQDIRDPDGPARLKRLVADADLVVALHSTNADSVTPLAPYESILQSRRAPLVVFVGNEFSSPIPGMGMRDKIALLQRLGPEFVATQLPVDVGRWLYEDVPNACVVSIPHGLNPAHYRPTIPPGERRIDVGVRTARYNSLLGDNDRVDIVRRFMEPFDPPLVVDVSMDQGARLTRTEWAAFLNGCRGTVATEAGTGFLEKDDATVRRAADYLRQKMKRSDRCLQFATRLNVSKLIPGPLQPALRRILSLLGLRAVGATAHYHAADFQDLHDRFFRDYPHPVSGKCVSSRHFEAIGTMTCQIMFPGRFNDVLHADRHYLALRRDFSNLDDVVSRLRDPSCRERVTTEAREYVLSAHTYQHRVDELVRLIGA